MSVSGRFWVGVVLFGLAALVVLAPLLWFLIVPIVVYGGAFVGDLFDRFGDTSRVVAAYLGLLLTAVLVLGLLGAVAGVVLASLVNVCRLVLLRMRT
jgi:TRAP-type mannitol/chloroaromatic compound transport system permease large subunit